MGFVRAPGAVPFAGAGLFACKAGGTAEAGMSANRGKFVSSIAALRPTDAPATTGRSAAGFFEAVFASWALSASRGLSPSRGGPFCVAAREAWRSVGKAGRTAEDRPVCVAARGNYDNFWINRLYFTFSANIYMCFTVLCHERQSLRIYCLMSIGDNDTDIWRERS